MNPRSITLRIALLFATVSALILLLTGAWISAMLDRHFEEQDTLELHGKLELIRNLVEGRDARSIDRLPAELARALVGHHELGVIVLDGHGDTLFASLGERLSDTLRRHPFPDGTPVEFKDPERGYRGLGMAIDTGLADPGKLRIGVLLDITHHERFLTEVRHTLWIGIAVVTLVMGAFGGAIARSGLAPLRRLTGRITKIDPNRLAERVPDAGVPPELRPLLDAFNAMLARLENGFARLASFSSDIAHELRTPLANLRTQTEVCLGRTREADAYRAVLHSALEEYERLSRMVDDMLLLARAENGRLPAGAREVDLRREVDALTEFYGVLAEDRGLTLVADGGAKLCGDAPMLRRAIANLLSNAIRHATTGTAIRIELGSVAGEVRIAVSNRGPDIPPEALPRLFDRFFRADPSRHHDNEGAGLGLAITRSIVEAHGGRITVRSDGGETVFECRFAPCSPVVRGAPAPAR